MNKKYLKILPGVAVVLFSTSCCKDDDTVLKADDITIVKEQVAEKQVIYLKVRNSSKLSKMALKDDFVKGDQTMDLQFEEGDKVRLHFAFMVDKTEEEYVYKKVTITAEYDESSDSFVITNDPEKMVFEDTEYQKKWDEQNPEKPLSQIAFDFAEDLLTNYHSFASGYSSDHNFYEVRVYWGNEKLDYGNKGYVECASMKDMFYQAPRFANRINYNIEGGSEFNLGSLDYAFIVFEDGCKKTVTVNGNKLDPTKFYSVKYSGTKPTVKIDDVEVSLIKGINYIRTNKLESNDEN